MFRQLEVNKEYPTKVSKMINSRQLDIKDFRKYSEPEIAQGMPNLVGKIIEKRREFKNHIKEEINKVYLLEN